MGLTGVSRECRRIWAQLHKAVLRVRLGRGWAVAERAKEALTRRAYPDYQTYLTHQRLKFDALRVKSIQGHDRRFYAALTDRLDRCPIDFAHRSVLCLAARLGTEVRAFVDQGAFAVGIDLNPGRDNRWVVVGDFHALQYADASVDVVYTNSLDHVFELERVLAEVHRVLEPQGFFLVEMGLGTEEGGEPGFYEALAWSRVDELLGRITDAGFAVRDRASFDLPWRGLQVVLEKAEPVV